MFFFLFYPHFRVCVLNIKKDTKSVIFNVNNKKFKCKKCKKLYKYYRQTHKMDYMLFASVTKSFLTKELHKKIMKFAVN